MSGKYFFATAAVASVLALTTPAHAQLLGGGLTGAVGGTLSGGLSGVDRIGDMTATATSTARDVNSIGRATTQHAHDTVSATADATDRAAANVDKQLESTKAAADATANAAASAASNVDAHAVQPKLDGPKAPVTKPSEPVKPVNAEPAQTPAINAAVSGSASGQSNASLER